MGKTYGHFEEAEIFTVDDFNAALAALPWRQVDGQPMHVDELGQEYVTLIETSLVRPGDVAIATGFVLQRGMRRLKDFVINELLKTGFPVARTVDGQTGVIHWRVRPEFAAEKHPVVLRYADDGPDIDHVTDRRCFKDHDWLLAKLYMRVSFVPTTWSVE